MAWFRRAVSALLATHIVHTSRASLTTGAIFPLYIYPDSNCSSWSTALDSISANPTLQFYLIANPDSGPVANPDPGYRNCIPEALSSGNVKVVGYVRTGYGNRSSSDVLDDVATYMAWDSAYRPSGIFFDETAATSALLSTYTTYANQVRADVTNDSLVILNPGIMTQVSGYFSIADMIVTAETFYDDFSLGSLIISDSEPASNQAVILHDGPSSLPTSLVDRLTGAGLGAVFITDKPQAEAYSTISTYWEQFCEELVSSQE